MQIWMRVIQIVTNKEELQAYAAETCLRALKSDKVDVCMVKCGGYMLGEFGHLVADKPGCSGAAQCAVLKEKLHTANDWQVKQMLVSALAKLLNAHPQLRPQILELMHAHTTTMDPELQQRAVEYVALAQPGREGLLEKVMDLMPNFPERESILTRKIKERELAATTDRTLKQIQTQGLKPDDDESPELPELDLAAGSAAHTKTRAAAAATHAISSTSAAPDLLDLSSPAAPSSHAASAVAGTQLTSAAAASALDDLLGASAPPPAPPPHAPPAANSSSSSSSMLDDLLGLAAPAPPASLTQPSLASQPPPLAAGSHARTNLDLLDSLPSAPATHTRPPPSAMEAEAAGGGQSSGANGLGAVYEVAMEGKGMLFEGDGFSIHAQVAVQVSNASLNLQYPDRLPCILSFLPRFARPCYLFGRMPLPRHPALPCQPILLYGGFGVAVGREVRRGCGCVLERGVTYRGVSGRGCSGGAALQCCCWSGGL